MFMHLYTDVTGQVVGKVTYVWGAQSLWLEIPTMKSPFLWELVVPALIHKRMKKVEIIKSFNNQEKWNITIFGGTR